ncbi:MAG: helix-turn-helix domain-containing protein [Acidimicrobiales bacterium]
MVRARKRPSPPPTPTDADEPTDTPGRDGPMDVNAVVSYNVKAIRERHGWTQQGVADRLARLTGHTLPQASISAMERGFDGERRRRFDAHELYLLSVVFDVPLAYFFLPPPGAMGTPLADTGVPAARLYTAILGDDLQLPALDERLETMGLHKPTDLDPVMATISGGNPAALNWHDHYRTWRKNRIALIAREYGDQLDDLADVLADFANKIKNLGPHAYLQATAHRPGETPFVGRGDPEQ